MYLLIAFLMGVFAGLSPQHPSMPKGMSHEEHMKALQKEDALKRRGAETMGFDQDVTAHHFRLSAGGGSIEVTAKPGAAEGVVAQVRAHLKMIAGEFSSGRFDKPFATHAEMPPGVDVMKARASVIAYTFEAMPRGAAVRIRSQDADAVRAIHAFLKYQIVEHKTGDPLVVTR